MLNDWVWGRSETMWHSFYKQWIWRLRDVVLSSHTFLQKEKKYLYYKCPVWRWCDATPVNWCEQWKWVVHLDFTYSENEAKLLYQHKLPKVYRSKLSLALKEQQKIPVEAVIWGSYILWISAPKYKETEQEEYEVNANSLCPFKSEDASSLIKSSFKSYTRNLPKGREQVA